jgi:hypothetical protein
VCEECRGLPLTPHPKSASPGRTSKIARYYWRELALETLKRFDVWSQTRGCNRTPAEDREIKSKIRRDVLEELKSLHETAPKYIRSRRPARPRSSTNTASKSCHLRAPTSAVTQKNAQS